MAAIITTRPSRAVSAGYLLQAISQIFAHLNNWNDARITRKALSKLSARELDDIGLSYGDLNNIAARRR